MVLAEKIILLLTFIVGVTICKGTHYEETQHFQSSAIWPYQYLPETPNGNYQDIFNNVDNETQTVARITHGTDGVTIATFQPSNKQFVIDDGEFYTCSGGILYDSDAYCSGTLKPYPFNRKSDFCYSSSKSLINSKFYCLSLGGTGITTAIIEGKVYCETESSPALLISLDEYNSICQNVATSVTYKYFTAKHIPELDGGIKCEGYNPQICTYSTNLLDVHSGINLNE